MAFSLKLAFERSGCGMLGWRELSMSMSMEVYGLYIMAMEVDGWRVYYCCSCRMQNDRKVFVSLGSHPKGFHFFGFSSKRFSYLSDPKGFRIFRIRKVFVFIYGRHTLYYLLLGYDVLSTCGSVWLDLVRWGLLIFVACRRRVAKPFVMPKPSCWTV